MVSFLFQVIRGKILWNNPMLKKKYYGINDTFVFCFKIL